MLTVAVSALSWAAPPPMAGPCCGQPPITAREPDEADPVLPVVGFPLRVGGSEPEVTAAVCRAHMSSCNLRCDEVDPPDWAMGAPFRSSPIELGGGRSAVLRRVARGTTVCWEEEWVLEGAAAGGGNEIAWLGISGGGGTKGASTSSVHRTAPLGDGYLWVEIQVDDTGPDSRHVVLWGVAIGVVDLGVHGPIPLWVDGTDRAGPAQIDVTWDRPHHVVVAARTPTVAREQQAWLGGWSLP